MLNIVIKINGEKADILNNLSSHNHEPIRELKVRALKIQLREKVKDGKNSVSYDLMIY